MNLHHDKHKRIDLMQHSSSELTTSNIRKTKLINDFFVNIGKNPAVQYRPHEDEDQTMNLTVLLQSDTYNQGSLILLN